MARKPESVFTSSVNAYLQKEVYFEKMNNPYRSGTADYWYTGSKGDLWVEYKYCENLPINGTYSLGLTERQKKWLSDRFHEGRNVAVILGVRKGGVIFTDLSWIIPMKGPELWRRAVSRPDVASWIKNQTGTSPCKLQEPSGLPPL